MFLHSFIVCLFLQSSINLPEPLTGSHPHPLSLSSCSSAFLSYHIPLSASSSDPWLRLSSTFSEMLAHTKIYRGSISLVFFSFCVFAGTVKLRLEQEGEAQLGSKRCGLHSQVQPGEAHSQFALMSHSVLHQVSSKRREETVPYAVLKIYETWSSSDGEIAAPLSIMSSASILQPLNHHPSSPRGGCF